MHLARLLVVLFVVTSSRLFASSVNIYLQADVSNQTWTLSASTDSPGGLGAVVVDLVNVDTGLSMAPRAAGRGFIIGNGFPGPATGEYKQAFSAQHPIPIESIVYGIGYTPVPASDFGIGGAPPIDFVGDATLVPTLLYTGTFSSLAALPAYRQTQSPNAAIVYLSPPAPGAYERPVVPDTISFIVAEALVPEPSTIALALLSVPAFFVLRHRLR